MSEADGLRQLGDAEVRQQSRAVAGVAGAGVCQRVTQDLGLGTRPRGGWVSLGPMIGQPVKCSSLININKPWNRGGRACLQTVAGARAAAAAPALLGSLGVLTLRAPVAPLQVVLTAGLAAERRELVSV